MLQVDQSLRKVLYPLVGHQLALLQVQRSQQGQFVPNLIEDRVVHIPAVGEVDSLQGRHLFDQVG